MSICKSLIHKKFIFSTFFNVMFCVFLIYFFCFCINSVILVCISLSLTQYVLYHILYNLYRCIFYKHYCLFIINKILSYSCYFYVIYGHFLLKNYFFHQLAYISLYFLLGFTIAVNLLFMRILSFNVNILLQLQKINIFFSKNYYTIFFKQFCGYSIPFYKFF